MAQLNHPDHYGWAALRPAIWLLVSGALCWHLIWRMDGLGLFLMLLFIGATALLESDSKGTIR